jgi:GH18 family chitinase
MKTTKAYAIFTEDEKETAECYLEDLKLDHPRAKMFRLKKNAQKHDKNSVSIGGWAISSKPGLVFETNHRTGTINV